MTINTKAVSQMTQNTLMHIHYVLYRLVYEFYKVILSSSIIV